MTNKTYIPKTDPAVSDTSHVGMFFQLLYKLMR